MKCKCPREQLNSSRPLVNSEGLTQNEANFFTVLLNEFIVILLLTLLKICILYI
jgi:hypothetical protein